MVDALAAGIGPDLFWSLTPHQIGQSILGYRRRLIHQQAIAQYAATISVSPWSKSKRPIQPPFKED
jgi:hypothetical protein